MDEQESFAPSNNDSARVRAAARGETLGLLILDLWRSVRINWSFATDHLSQAFRSEKQLGAADRRFVAEVLYGMIRHLRRLDAALAAGGVRGKNVAPDRERLVAYLLLECGLAVDQAQAAVPRVDWRTVSAIDDKLAALSRPVERIGTLRSLPDWLVSRLLSNFGEEETDALAAALNCRAPMTLRVNTLRATREQLIERLSAEGIEAHAGRYAPTAVIVDTRTNLFSLAAFREGLFEAQDEGSQLIASLVAPPPRSVVVDACAGAGGKTLALSAALANKGRLIATDVERRKLQELRRRARRAGVTNAAVAQVDRSPAADWPRILAGLVGKVSRVLVDAPCTGIGSLRRNPEARWRISAADADRMPALQRQICQRFAELVEPGGRMIYATCTVLQDENENVVNALLADNPDLEVMPAKAVWGKEVAAPITDVTGTFLRVVPHVHGTDGFFAAVLRRPPK